MPQTILLVDDEPRIVQIARDYLVRAGFAVYSAGDGLEALRIAQRERPTLIVLDIMLPGMDGLAVVRSLRRDPDLAAIPIILLTARVEETDRVLGLELGADDYITKPFSPRELVARIRAVLRRFAGNFVQNSRFECGDLLIDWERRSVMLRQRPVELTTTEFAVLQVLARAPGRPFSREQLLDRAFAMDFAGYDRTIDAHIKNLRRKLEDDPREPRYILTIYGVGYKFADC